MYYITQQTKTLLSPATENLGCLEVQKRKKVNKSK